MEFHKQWCEIELGHHSQSQSQSVWHSIDHQREYFKVLYPDGSILPPSGRPKLQELAGTP
jgi:hypothetical protein